MVIQHNLTASNSSRMLGLVNRAIGKSSEKLASGYRINRSADDAAGLAISEKMRRQVRGLAMSSRNAQDGISLIQVVDGALNEDHAILHRMNTLAIQAANGTISDEDRGFIDEEIQRLKDEIDDTTRKVLFNEKPIFPTDGSPPGDIASMGASGSHDLSLHVGPEAGQTITLHFFRMDSDSLGLGSTNTLTVADSNSAIDQIKDAISQVSQVRNYYGATQNRLEHTIRNLNNIHENTTSAEAQIRDTDMAAQMMDFSNHRILQRAAESVMTQANQSNAGVQTLLS